MSVLLIFILVGCLFMYTFISGLVRGDESDSINYVFPLLPSLLIALLFLGGAITLIVKDFQFKKRVCDSTIDSGHTNNESLLSGIADELNSRIVNLFLGIIICIFLIQWWAGFVLLIAHVVFIIGAIFWYGRKAK